MSEQDRLIQAAEERHADARHLFEGERYSGAVSSSYYAVFNAAKALLIEEDSRPKTHQGVSSELGRLFRDELEPETTRRYSRLQTQRERADYDPGEDFDRDEARSAVRFSEKFVSGVQEMIGADGSRDEA